MSNKFEYCIPIYNGEGNWHSIDAYDAESAAEKAGEHYNEDGDYPLMDDGNPVFVLVRENTESPVQVFKVYAEASISYYTDSVDKLRCKHCGKDLMQEIVSSTPYRREGDYYCNYECYGLYYDTWYKEHKKKYG